MNSSSLNEKKPAGAGVEQLKLLDFDALIFRNCGGDGFSVSTLGAIYSQPPRCCDVSVAVVDWVASCSQGGLVVDAALDKGIEAEGITHILSFIDAMSSSFWMHYRPATVVEVPGLGRWFFQPSEVVCHE